MLLQPSISYIAESLPRFCACFVFECYGDHRDLHVLTHSFPTRRSADLVLPVVREVPVIAGVMGTDPMRRMDHLLCELDTMGFSWINNFPTVDRKSTRLNSSH